MLPLLSGLLGSAGGDLNNGLPGFDRIMSLIGLATGALNNGDGSDLVSILPFPTGGASGIDAGNITGLLSSLLTDQNLGSVQGLGGLASIMGHPEVAMVLPLIQSIIGGQQAGGLFNGSGLGSLFGGLLGGGLNGTSGSVLPGDLPQQGLPDFAGILNLGQFQNLGQLMNGFKGAHCNRQWQFLWPRS